MGHFLHLAGGGHKGPPPYPRLRDRLVVREAREHWIGTAGSCCLLPPQPYPSVLLPGQLGEVWVWWGLAGKLQEGPVLSKNSDPGVVK